MGKKGSWLSSIKKTMSPISKDKKIQKSKRKELVEDESSIPDSSFVENDPFPLPEEVKDQPKNACGVVVAATVPAAVEAAAAESSRAAESNQCSVKPRDEAAAAIRIQTAFRGYSARRALWALRGLVRLKKLVDGPVVKRQTANTQKCMQSLSHVQAQINSSRARMSEENQVLQIQILQKRAKEIENLQMGDEWNDSVQSKEEMEAKLLSKYEATMRRERAMAYSFSHQQPRKKSVGSANLLFMDPTNPQWGWSWLERYTAARIEKEPGKDHGPVRNNINISGTEIVKSYARYQLNSTPSTPRARTGVPVASRKPKHGLNPSPSPSPRAFVSGSWPGPDDDSKSIVSVQSERNKRHCNVGSVAGDDESLGGSPMAPKYMAATKAGKAKSRGQRSWGMAEIGGGSMVEKGSGSVGGVKKQLSYPASPARPRRHSGPPKVEMGISAGAI